MPGGKGKSIGGKGGSKDSAGKAQKSHSAKAGLQVSDDFSLVVYGCLCISRGRCAMRQFPWKRLGVGTRPCNFLSLATLAKGTPCESLLSYICISQLFFTRAMSFLDNLIWSTPQTCLLTYFVS